MRREIKENSFRSNTKDDFSYEKRTVTESSAFEQWLRITSARVEARGEFQVNDEVREGTDSERTKRRYSTARKRDRRERARMEERNGHSSGKGAGGRGRDGEKVKREVKEE